ncbi:MAG: SEC-C metal-binding domain-containing protein, partial [Steroidobacteraceae bacterium]
MPPGRNEACPCGSGRKFKHCCGNPPPAAPAPKRSLADAARAWALLQSGRPAEAEIECERLLALEPMLGQALLCLALAQRARGKDALAALESASRSLPGDAQVHHLLGQTLEDHGLLDRAAECFARAIVLRPEFAEA